MHFLWVDEELPLVKMKNISQIYIYFEENFFSSEVMSSPNERRDSYQEFSVCDICHGIVDQYFSWKISCEEVIQGNSFEGKGATNCCSYDEMAACGRREYARWSVLSKHGTETQCLAFPVPTSEIPLLWMEMCMLCKEEWALRLLGMLITGSWIMSLTKGGQLKSHPCS